MNDNIPRTPFSTALSGSAKVTKLRIQNILSGPKKRPPALFLAAVFALCIFCGNLVSCQMAQAEPPRPDIPVDWDHLAEPDLSLAQVDLDNLPEPEPLYTLEDDGNVRIGNLGEAIVVWNRSSTGNFLYFAGDPAFCCPSLAGRAAEGSAKWQGEPWGAVVVDISVNDDRLEDGTIDGYHLQFTADWGKEAVLESSFTSEVGDGVLELSEEEMFYAGRILWHLMLDAEWLATVEPIVFSQRPDLNRNGVPEELRLYIPADYGSGQQLEIWEDGKRIYRETGDEAHVGWNAVFLCTLEGEDYLLHYSPYMNQGAAGYGYHLSTLEGNHLRQIREKELFFEVNFGMPTPDGGVVDPDDIFDVDAIASFMEEINDLLSHSVQLLNTDQDLLWTFEREGRLEDTLRFLNNDPDVFASDPRKSLRENLWDYRDTMVQLVSER